MFHYFKAGLPGKLSRLFLAAFLGIVLVSALMTLAKYTSTMVHAEPIDPPAGYPKFILSTKTVSPTLVKSGGATLWYSIEIVNTGAYTGYGVTLQDDIPLNTAYNQDAASSVSPSPVYTHNMLTWSGTVGFDSSVLITYSVTVSPTFEGVVSNTAVISHPAIAQPVLAAAQAVVSDDPLFEIDKTALPGIPGPGKPLTYTIAVTNRGQPAAGLPVTVTDQLPQDTSFLSAGTDGSYSSQDNQVIWKRLVDLNTGETAWFSFTVQVGDVPSGTVITNDHYQVADELGGLSTGQVYTTSVLDPILFLYKDTQPFPPGSNQEMTYTLTVLNKGSLATDLVVSDKIPAGVTYLRGGHRTGNQVTWTIDKLDTGESVQLSFTVFIGDVAEFAVINSDYQACTPETVCQTGIPLTSVIKGPTFEAAVLLDPIAKKPGGGGGPVTPTLTVKNLGPGNALDATAMLYFRRISVSGEDLVSIPNVGVLSDGPDCGDKCVAYRWIGDLSAGEGITFTTLEGQSTIGGEEGTNYTATVVISDVLSDFSTQPITATAIGRVTHFANLIPTKSAPTVIGTGQTMTYTLYVFNSGLSTDVPPYPTLTDTVPSSTTLVSVGDGGTWFPAGDQTVVSWTLPAMSPGDLLTRAFSVQVGADLLSGTQIVNDDYRTYWFNMGTITETPNISNTGVPITTVVKEVGLIDSYKTVTPTTALPGPGNVLTYVLNVLNTSPVPLTGVSVHDVLPWEFSTYQRDAVASSGSLISDIVSLDWHGNVAAYASASITYSVLVDPYFQGTITNTAWINHSSLHEPVVVNAVSYITYDPVLKITKTAFPDPVHLGDELFYTLQVTNLGQQATELVVTDTVPANTTFVPYSASGNGQWLSGENQVLWSFPVLLPGEDRSLSFAVRVASGRSVTNDRYGVVCVEGVSAAGKPVVTKITGLARLYLPMVMR
jgi:uncharacterized repeat protein (TIGR01451 family)